jgi:putative glutamine amidotransferase
MSRPSDPPLIGITTYREQARWGVWDTRADVLHAQYADAVAAAVVARIDGLVVSGGADVDPARYDEEPHPSTASWREDRDAWETALLRATDGAALPTLGVCRGMQLMAVAAGGSLVQHLPDLVGHDGHSPGADAFGATEVRTADKSLLRSLVGPRLEVGCHHHQTVASHPGFEATAWAADGSLEAMERPGPRFCLAVQWHPEVRDDGSLFAGLVAAATARAG